MNKSFITTVFILTGFLFFSGCSSKTDQIYEKLNVCVTPNNEKNIDTYKIKSDLDKEAVNKCMDKYSNSLINDIRFTERFYYNLEEIKKYCLKTTAVITRQNRPKKSKPITVKNFCYKKENTNKNALIKKASENGLIKKISKINPELKNADWNILKKSIFDINSFNHDYSSDENKICLDIKAKYYPSDLKLLASVKNFKNIKFRIKEDFINYNSGDQVKKYGKGLIIQKTKNGNALTSFLQNKKTSADFFAGKKENIELKLLLDHIFSDNTSKSDVHIPILKLKYINSKTDDFKIILKKDKFSKYKADFMVGRHKSENIDISFADNYNVFKIIKNNREIRVFLNGKFTGAFMSAGNIVDSVEVIVDQQTLLKSIEIKEI
ncbi:MAG: hypothetical protein ACQESP_11845 [Candidatus Muiribacteriota bacterium]